MISTKPSGLAAGRTGLAPRRTGPAAPRRGPPAPRIVLLAAGFSLRMGKPKALARVRGRSLIARTLRVLSPSATAAIIVVVPARASRLCAELRSYGAMPVANPLAHAGLSSSVRRGLRQARYEAAVLLVPVDLPYLEQRDIARLITRWRGARRRVAARRIGTEAGAPLILPRRLYRIALGIAGDVGLKALIRHLPAEDVALVSLNSAAFDVDTPRDLERSRRRTRPRQS
jgi:molybdenum cofactor cytidylyltransferase